MDREQARAYVERWKLVNETEIRELRETSVETKFRQLAALMESALALGWTTTDEAEVEAVRERWNRLRRLHRG
jgi:hypothetical protein